MVKGILSVLIITVLVALLSLASLMISENVSLGREEVRAYECGFEHFSHSRLPFSFRYFLLTIIFLVFDMEIVFLLFLPESLSMTLHPIVLIISSLIFLILLVMGLFYEWNDGRLDWVM